MANVFAKAKQAATTPTAKATKKKERPQVAISGLNGLAAIHVIEKSFETLKETFETDVKNKALAHFIEEGIALKRAPENFRGLDTHSSASLELKKRSTKSVISADDKKLLDKYGISYDTGETVTTTYMINPKYKDDEKLLSKVSAALETLGIPGDFIEMQVGTPIYTSGEKTIDDVFAAELDEAVTRDLLKIVATQSCKPTYDLSLTDALEFAKSLIQE